MKTESYLRFCTLSSVLLLAGTALSQNTSFTYHGRLTTGGAPADGQYDMVFAILGESSATPVTPPQTNVVPITAGLFMVPLPATTDVFNGARRFLQISVRTNGSAGPFTILSPLQEITSAPYATRAVVADTAAVATSVNPQSIGPDHILAAGLPGPGKVLLYNGSAWVWTNLSTAAAGWLLGGNSGAGSGSNSVGTLDAQPLEFIVNRLRALRLEAGSNGTPNVIGGSARNAATPGVSGAAIAGGGSALSSNVVQGDFGGIGGGAGNRAGEFSVVSGGEGNTARGDHAVIGGGLLNDIAPGLDSYYAGTVPSSSSLIGGGEQNQILSVYSVIAGGSQNFIGTNAGDTFLGGGFENAIFPGAYFSTLGGGNGNIVDRGAEFGLLGGGEENWIGSNADHSVLVGGYENLVSGVCAMILGGRFNTAAGRVSFAGGEWADAAHAGTFVWASGATSDFSSTSSNQFLIRAPGGVGLGTNNPRAQLHVRGTNMADVFQGAFVGNGAGLTNLPASGTLAGAAYLSSNQTFTGLNLFNGPVLATNAGSQFSGNGSLLTALNANNLASGVVPDTRLSNNLVRLNQSQTFTGTPNFAPATGPPFIVANTIKVTGLNADRLDGMDSAEFASVTHTHSGADITSGTVADARLSGNVLLRTGTNFFTASNTFSGVVVATNTANIFNGGFTGTFTGNGGGLSNLAAATLPTNIAFLNSNQTFTASNIFTGVVKATNGNNLLSGTFTGDGTALNLSNAVNTASVQNNSITAPKIASGQVVKAFNGLTDAVTLAAGANVTITPAGNTLTIASSGSGVPSNTAFLNSNQTFTASNTFAGVVIINGDLTASRLKVGPSHSLSGGLASIAGGSANTNRANWGFVGAGRDNTIEPLATWAVIGGGVQNTIQTNAGSAVIAGGFINTIQTNAQSAAIGGGSGNLIMLAAQGSVISGGENNTIQTNAQRSVIGGGSGNAIHAGAQYSTIAGGAGNVVSNGADYAAIPGGSFNSVGGDYGFAAGRRAKAAHQGAFVWSDSNLDSDFTSTAIDQFSVRANGGVRFVTGGTGATLNGLSILAGTVGSSQLSGTYSSALTFNNTTNSFSGTFAGNGTGLFGLWKTAGNSGTTSADFLGTTDNQPLEFKVNSTRALRLEPNAISPNVIGGFEGNQVTSGAYAATIGGGGDSFGTNLVSGNFGTVAGGRRNTATLGSTVGGGWSNAAVGPVYSTVSGGHHNLANGSAATISGGSFNIATNDHATVVGGSGNRATGVGSFVGGGANNEAAGEDAGIVSGYSNSVSGTYSFIGGGFRNQASGYAAVVTGGGGLNPQTGLYVGNTASGTGASVGGGFENYARGTVTTVGGGIHNVASNIAATVGGGYYNQATNQFATVPGGSGCIAGGAGSFAAGVFAFATHSGAFVWSDNSSPFTPFSSTANNQVSFRCAGGVLFTSGINGSNQTNSWVPGGLSWSFTSDRNSKDRFATLDSRSVLEKVAHLPLSEWSYIGYPQRHIGPMAQDFHEQFPLNENDKMIDSGDLQGVALAAIQGLNQKVDETAKKKDSEVAALRKQNAALEERVAELEKLVRHLVQTQASR